MSSARDIADASASVRRIVAGGEPSGSSRLAQDASRTDASAATPSSDLDLLGILSAVQETAYTWHVLTDRIDWADNACEVLGIRSPSREMMWLGEMTAAGFAQGLDSMPDIGSSLAASAPSLTAGGARGGCPLLSP